MNQDQITSLVRSVLKVAGAALAAHGAQQWATIATTPDMAEAVSGAVMTGIGIYLSHVQHATPKV
jgi:hypothetical protein